MAVKTKARQKIEQTRELAERRAEESIHLRMAWEAIPLPLFACSEQHAFLFANRRFRTLLGYFPDELRGRSVDSIFQVESDEHLSRLLASFLPGDQEWIVGLDRALYARSKAGQAVRLALSLGSWEDAGQIVWSGRVLCSSLDERLCLAELASPVK